MGGPVKERSQTDMTDQVCAPFILGWIFGAHETNLGQQRSRGIDSRPKALASIAVGPVRALGRRERVPVTRRERSNRGRVHMAHCGGGHVLGRWTASPIVWRGQVTVVLDRLH